MERSKYYQLLREAKRIIYAYSKQYHLSAYPGTTLSNFIHAVNNESDNNGINYGIY